MVRRQFEADFCGLLISHLQRLPISKPIYPSHSLVTPNLSWSQTGHNPESGAKPLNGWIQPVAICRS